jgi:hypothetical protein
MDVQPDSNSVRRLPNALLAFAGAAAGGVAGYFAFGWLARQGFSALALPGVLIGLGAGRCVPGRSLPLAVTCGISALVLGVFAEWKHFPFLADDSLGYFLAHLLDLRPFTLLMLALGGFAGFWFAWRGNGKPHSSSARNPSE